MVGSHHAGWRQMSRQPSNGAPSYLWRREPQCDGSVRWYLHVGLRRTRWFVERPANVADRHSRGLRYVLCCVSLNRAGCAEAEGAYGTLEQAKHGAELAAA